MTYDTDILTIEISNKEAGEIPTGFVRYQNSVYNLDKTCDDRYRLSNILLGGNVVSKYIYTDGIFGRRDMEFIIQGAPISDKTSLVVDMGEFALSTANIMEGLFSNPVKELFRRRDLVLQTFKDKLPKVDLVFTSAEVTEVHQYYAVRNGNHIQVEWDNEYNQLGEVIINGEKIDLYSNFTTSARTASLLDALLKNKCPLPIECRNYYSHRLEVNIGKLVTVSIDFKDNDLEDIKWVSESTIKKYLSDLLLLVDEIVTQINTRLALVLSPIKDRDHDFIVTKHLNVKGKGKYFYFHFCPNTYKFVKCIVGDKTYGDEGIYFYNIQCEAIPGLMFTNSGIFSNQYEMYHTSQDNPNPAGVGTKFKYGIGYYSLLKSDLNQFWDDFTSRIAELEDNLT
jgi:hypothetical protein